MSFADGRAPTRSTVAPVATTSTADPVTTTCTPATDVLTRGSRDPRHSCQKFWSTPAPNEVFGQSGNDFLAGNLGNDRLDGGLGFDSGTGGYHDGRIDWITSVERPDECDSR